MKMPKPFHASLLQSLPEPIAEPAATICAGLTRSNDHHDAEPL